MAQDNVATSCRLLEEGFTNGNVGVADEVIAASAVSHDPAEPAELRAMRGPELFKRTVSMYRTAFPDLRLTIEDAFGADDKVVVRWRCGGTHRGDLHGLAPTGAEAVVTGMSIDRYEDGKIVETWSEWDNLGLARQIGAAPPEGSRGERVGAMVQHLTARRMRRRAGAPA
jgi:predicted ester cyclase